MLRHRHIVTSLIVGALLSLSGQAHAQRKSPEERYEEMKKSPLLAATIEWVVPLIGHDYAGDKAKGVPPFLLMAGGLTVFVAAGVGMMGCPSNYPEPSPDPDCGNTLAVVGKLGALTVLASRIWASVSAWKLANGTNAHYRRYLRLDDADLALSVTPAGQLGLGVSLRF